MRFSSTIICILLLVFGIVNISFSQSVGVNDDGSSPNSKAMLDVKSNTKGLLIPRMSTADRLAIAPVMSEKGIMVYDTSVNAFFYYTGVEWREVSEALWMKDPNGINRTSSVGINVNSTTNNNLYVHRPFGVVGADTSTIYAYRGGDETGFPGVGGSSFGVTGVDAAIKGFSDYGNPFSAGVAGYGYLDYENSAALIGSNNSGTTYGILGFRDTSNLVYAGYFKGNTMVVGDTRVVGNGRYDSRVGIGIAPSTLFTLNVQSSTEDRTGYFYNTKTSASATFGIYGGAFGTGSGAKRGGSFDAFGGTGTNIGMRAVASNGLTNIAVYGSATGGTTNWAGHFENGFVIVNDRIGIGTTSPQHTVHASTSTLDRAGYFYNTKSTAASTYGVYGGAFGTGSGDKRGGAFDASGGTGTNIGMRAVASNGTTNIAVYGIASGGTNNWAAHFDGGDVIVDDRVGIGTQAIASGVGLHVMSQDIRMEGNNDFFNVVSTSTTNLNGIRFYNGGTFQGALFYDSGDDLLNITGSSITPVLVTDFANNSVGIGTFNTAAGYKLSVDGKIISEELRIRNSTNWPDYVFAEDYRLMPLDELEMSIILQKHLPNIPSASEVESEGILVGDMQKRMMEKIEELTLYVIEINKHNQVLSNEVEILKKELTELKQN